MYEERKSNFEIKSVILQILFVVLFVFILMWLFPSKQFVTDSVQGLYDRIFNENILMMKDSAKSYFTTSRLPQNVGDSVTLTLSDMLDKKIVLPFVDSSGNQCDLKKSYVKVTKKDDEYVMKVNLKCTDQENYLLVYMGCYDYCKTTICEKDDKDVKTPTITPVSTGGKAPSISNSTSNSNKCTNCCTINNTTVNNIINNITNIVITPPTPTPTPTPEPGKPTPTPTPEPGNPTPTPTVYEYEYLKTTAKTCTWSNNWSEWTETRLYPNDVTQVKTKTRTTTTTVKKITAYKVTKYYDTNKPIFETQKIQTGSYEESQCASYKTETSTSQHYEILDASVSVGSNYHRVDSYYDDCNKQCTSHLVIKYLVTETSSKQVCASYKTVTVPVYSTVQKLVGYELVTKKEPIYSYVNKENTVKLYSSRTCTPKDGTISKKWSTSSNDKSLINEGYKYTGNRRVKS